MITEQGMPYFPHDYPDTMAYKEWAAMTELDLVQTYTKKPPAKRPNFSTMKIIDPFNIPWGKLLSQSDKSSNQTFCVLRGEQNLPSFHIQTALHARKDPSLRWVPKTGAREFPYWESSSLYKSYWMNSLIQVTIRMKKGQVSQRAIIAKPLQSDYEKFRKDPLAYKNLEEPNDKQHESLTRITIGYVTSGGYSYIRGKGFGLGFCSASLLYDFLRESHTYGLFP